MRAWALVWQEMRVGALVWQEIRAGVRGIFFQCADFRLIAVKNRISFWLPVWKPLPIPLVSSAPGKTISGLFVPPVDEDE